MSNREPKYYIAPKESFEATADAIRAVTGENGEIEWKSNGFADVLGNEKRYTVEDYLNHNISGEVTTSIMNLPSYSLREQKITKLIRTTSTVKGGMNPSSLQNCKQLTEIITTNPNGIIWVGANALAGCTSLQYLSRVYDLYGSSVSGCSNLSIVEFADSTDTKGIRGESCFSNCTSLQTIIIRRTDALILLNNVNVFDGTPFASGGTGGTIYIPEILYDHLGDGTSLDYQSATNWSTIHGYGTITWQKIEGSIYENTYADGTPVGGAS